MEVLHGGWSSADLAATQQRYRTLVEPADDLVVQFNLDGSVVYANDAFNEGRRDGRGGEVSIERSAIMSDDDKRNLVAVLPTVVERGKHSVHYSVAAASGESAYRYARLNLIRDESGSPDSILAIIRDVTDQRRLEEETVRLQEVFHQVQKLEAIGLPSASVAHDFNNILTIISGNAEIIRPKHPTDEQTCSHVDTILHAGLRAAELAGQLLTYSRRKIMSPEVIELDDQLAQSGTFLGRLLGENIAVQLEDRFGRLPPGEYVRLKVKDTGCGKSSEVQSHLFEPFFSTKGRERSTGLGLATVHSIIKQCGGHVSVTSEPGRGTVFVILLPRADSKLSERTTQQDAVVDGPANGTILIAEDDEGIRLVAATGLRERGIEYSRPRTEKMRCWWHPNTTTRSTCFSLVS